jgi:hypothetical protein
VYHRTFSNGYVLLKRYTSQPIEGGIVSYSASGHQRIGVAAGTKSPVSPSAAYQNQIIIYGLE